MKRPTVTEYLWNRHRMALSEVKSSSSCDGSAYSLRCGNKTIYRETRSSTELLACFFLYRFPALSRDT